MRLAERRLPLRDLGRRTAYAALWLSVLGCQAVGVPTGELPSEPIALLYRTPEEGRRHAELLAKEEASGERAFGPTRPGVAAVSGIRRYLESTFGAGPMGGAARRYPGSLALLDPRLGAVTIVKSARRGAIPQAWSADRRRLLFSQLESEYLQLYELDLVTDEVRRVTSGPTVHPRGCYGPDGRLVMMTLSVKEEKLVPRIVITDSGGLNPRPLSEGPGVHSPACAPDGSAVAWVVSLPGGAEWIEAVAPPVSGRARRLVPGRDPAFSPDGEWIVYAGPVKRGRELRRIRPDGTGRAPIGRGVFDEEFPSVSPDGRHVVYLVREELVGTLYLRRFDGTGDRILFNDGDCQFPVW